MYTFIVFGVGVSFCSPSLELGDLFNDMHIVPYSITQRALLVGQCDKYDKIILNELFNRVLMLVL